jgi:hypothetical protein
VRVDLHAEEAHSTHAPPYGANLSRNRTKTTRITVSPRNLFKDAVRPVQYEKRRCWQMSIRADTMVSREHLLAGGDKRTQSRDIATAIALAREL